MSFETFLAMTAAVLVLAATPGPVVLATIARSMSGGMRASIPFLFGVATADIIYAGLAMLGLSWIAATYGPVFEVIKWLGAGYLMWLGISLARSAFQNPDDVKTKPAKPESVFMGWLSGLVITLGNPKLILFYVSFLPTFVDLEAVSTSGAAWAVLWITLLFFGSNVLWGLSVLPVGRLLKSGVKNGISWKGKAVRLTGGGTLVGSGVWLLNK